MSPNYKPSVSEAQDFLQVLNTNNFGFSLVPFITEKDIATYLFCLVTSVRD